MMSSTAARSATRIGWLNCGTQIDDAVADPDVLGLQAQAVRNSSGAEQWEYSSRKWCSTAHIWSKPSSSASRTCSSAFM